MAHTLTRSQLTALTELHRGGERNANGRIRRATATALTDAGLARWDGGQRIVPAVHTYANGFGSWHAVVPAAVDRPAVVAAAIIRGELQARGTVDPRRVRVEVDPGTVSHPAHGVTSLTYREKA